MILSTWDRGCSLTLCRCFPIWLSSTVRTITQSSTAITVVPSKWRKSWQSPTRSRRACRPPSEKQSAAPSDTNNHRPLQIVLPLSTMTAKTIKPAGTNNPRNFSTLLKRDRASNTRLRVRLIARKIWTIATILWSMMFLLEIFPTYPWRNQSEDHTSVIKATLTSKIQRKRDWRYSPSTSHCTANSHFPNPLPPSPCREIAKHNKMVGWCSETEKKPGTTCILFPSNNTNPRRSTSDRPSDRPINPNQMSWIKAWILHWQVAI